MKTLRVAGPGDRLSVLCLGAHSDDIEIGAGGTLLGWLARGIRLDVHWCVLSGIDERGREAKASATDFLAAAENRAIEVKVAGAWVIDPSPHLDILTKERFP